MFRLPRSAAALVSLPVLALAASAHAGAVLTGEHKTLDNSQPPFTYTLSIDKDKVRMDLSNAGSNNFIYRADRGVFYVVDAANKSYTEMTKKDLESLANTMAAAMKKMQEQLANLPPEQRAMMEKMMGDNMPGGSDSKVTYKKIGAGKSGSWACDKYETWQDNEKKAELCMATPAQMGIPEGDFKVLKDMSKTFEKIAKDFKAMFPPENIEGAPVQATLFENGKAVSVMQVKQVKKENLAANLFDVPAGFTKKAMAMPPAGG